MTAQFEFFCSLDEERHVLRYLTKEDGTLVYDVTDGNVSRCEDFSVDDLPVHQAPLCLYFHQPAHGSLIWHRSKPKVARPTHGSLVKGLFAREEWDKRGLAGRDKMLDTDRSPIICYRRGTQHKGRIGQNTVISPPSDLRRVGAAYEKWVQRSLAWLRRRGTVVHDFRRQSDTIPNPHSIVNTIYAFPGVLAQIESKSHPYIILIEDCS